MPPALISDTTDTLLNLTSRNISDWLVKTQKQYYKRRSVTKCEKKVIFTGNAQNIRSVFVSDLVVLHLGSRIHFQILTCPSSITSLIVSVKQLI